MERYPKINSNFPLFFPALQSEKEDLSVCKCVYVEEYIRSVCILIHH